MAAHFHFEHSVAFSSDHAAEILRAIPALPGVFALHGPAALEGQAAAQPYLTRAADLRRRITRILAPPDSHSQSKRLNLRDRVARIDYTITGSEFESNLPLYHASAAIFGLDEARRRLKLRTPFFLRFTVENAYPRVYSTNRLSKRALDNFYGPFPSRAAADRYCDAVLDLFKLRRCHEELAPYPDHPGCVYGEMNKCLAPCNQACTSEGAAAYASEAAAVKRFFDNHGESLVIEIGLAREEASSAMEFEKAAELHAQWNKVKAAQSLADELVQPLPKLRAVIVQKASSQPQNSGILTLDEVKGRDPGISSEAPRPSSNNDEPTTAVFLMQSGCITGPASLSTLGVRAVKEQTSVGSSLFAQPLMLQAIPLEENPNVYSTANSAGLSQNSVIPSEARSAESKDPEEPSTTNTPDPSPLESPQTAAAPTLNPEARAAAIIAELEEKASTPTDLATLSDHLSLLRRWYYRPEKQRAGEVFFPNANQQWPIRRILNGAARMALGEPTAMAETQRDQAQRNPANEAQKPTRTKTLHAGRPDVERIVPAIDKPPTFKSRRKSQTTEPR